jgi:hypothetical protein
MSSLHDASLRYLSIGSQSFGIDVATEIPMLSCWAFIPTGASLGSTNLAMHLRIGGADPGLGAQVADSSPTVTGRVRVNAATVNGSTWAINAWAHVAVRYGPRNGASQDRQVWVNGSLSGTSPTTLTESGTFDSLYIGSSNAGNQHLRGRVAEAAVYKNVADPAALVAALQTKTPNHADCLALATPILYRPLKIDADGGIGTYTIVNNNTVTFDGGIHPTLTEPGVAAESQSIIMVM